jgi:hypothetical protein
MQASLSPDKQNAIIIRFVDCRSYDVGTVREVEAS